jgi:hypothetical protein
MTELNYELFALRYATRHARRGDHFIGGDPHDWPMPMDYFVWAARGRLPRSASMRMRLKMSS